MTGEQLKEQGVQRVLENNEEWADLAMSYLKSVAAWGDFTSDDLHVTCTANGIAPPHRNAWGALFRKASKLGLIKRVGYRKSQRPASHSRVVAVWRKA